MIHQILQWACSTRADFVLLGDWNIEATNIHVSRYCSSGGGGDIVDDRLGGPSPMRMGGSTCIDYALSKGDVKFIHRDTHKGVGDHLLVRYTIDYADAESPWIWPRCRRLDSQLTEKEIEENWGRSWTADLNALYHGLLTEAWLLLSNTAEDALGAVCRGRRRTDMGNPVRQSPKCTRSKDVQTLRLRQLLRTQRLIREAVTRPSQDVAEAARRRIQVMAGAWPQLKDCPLELAGGLVSELIRGEEADEKKASAAWRLQMAGLPSKRRRWIQKTSEEDAGVPGVDPSPQALASNLRDRQASVWCADPPEGLASPDFSWAPEVLSWLDEQRRLVEISAPTSTSLPRTLQSMASKAGGVDQWAPADLCRLPDDFFDALASLWSSMLFFGKLPNQMMRARVVGIPQVDGSGLRPLTILPAVCRAGISIITRQLGPWADSWAPENVQGGIPGRAMHDMNDELCAPFSRATANDLPWMGCKLDLSTCFDKVSRPHSDFVLARLGLPTTVSRLLHAADVGMERFAESKGAVDPRSICGAGGLPQGCPASMLRLAAMTAAWNAFMKSRAPLCRSLTYADDRLLWIENGSVQLLEDAMSINAGFERSVGWTDNDEKRRFFAIRTADRRRLTLHLRRPVDADIRFLGFDYALTRRRLCADTSRLRTVAERRCRRIAIAGGTFAVRKSLIRSLVLPLVTWLSPWSRPRKDHIKQLNSWIERAVQPAMAPGRCRYPLFVFASALTCLSRGPWRLP